MPRRVASRPPAASSPALRTLAAVSAVLATVFAPPAPAQDGIDRSFGSVEKSLEIDSGPLTGQTVRYRVLAPYDLEDDESLPVLLFLHGAGERGDDNLAQLRHLPEKFAREDYRARFRGIVVAPQCPRGRRWVEVDWSAKEAQPAPNEPSPWLDVALRALDATLESLPCDPDRVYLSGLSMGGFGAWHLAAREPERFAAVLPVCGGGDPTRASRLAGLPIWAWHGARDHVVVPAQSRTMVDAVRRAGGIIHYTELPRATHDAWSAAYAVEGGALGWLWQQRRGHRYLGYSLVCDPQTDRVLLLDNDSDRAEDAAPLWSWSGVHDTDPSIREGENAWFDDPTDARSTDLGTVLWTCSAAGGVARLRIADRKVTFHAYPQGNPAAVQPLGDGSAVVACRESGRLARYSPPSDSWDPRSAPAQEFRVPGVLGLAADSAGRTLYALSASELVGYRLEGGSLTETVRAPVDGGRLLATVSGRDEILVGTSRGVRWFDPATSTTTPCPRFDTMRQPELEQVRSLDPLSRLGDRSPLVARVTVDDTASAVWILEPVTRADGSVLTRSWPIPTGPLAIGSVRAWR